MNQTLRNSLFLIFTIAGSLFASENGFNTKQDIDSVKYPELAKFLVKHRCAQVVENAIEIEAKNVELVKRGHYNCAIFKYKNLPYYNKGADIARIDNARRMKKVIELYGITKLAVPDKCLCKNGDLWAVISSEVKEGGYEGLSKQEILDVMKMTEATNYSDWHNVIRDEHGKMVIIDTEDASFSDAMSTYDPYKYGQDQGFDSAFTERWFDNNVRAWLHNKIFKQSFEVRNSLIDQKKYNDPDIDFEKVKKEFIQLQAENINKNA